MKISINLKAQLMPLDFQGIDHLLINCFQGILFSLQVVIWFGFKALGNFINILVMVDKNSAPAFSIGLKTFNVNHDKKPGPGSYEQASSIKLASQHKVSSEKRFKQYDTIAPGPGTYKAEYKDHIPNAKIQSRAKQQKSPDVPGPGSYQPDYAPTHKSQSGFHLGKSPKLKELPKSSDQAPGPGNYETANNTMVRDKNAIKFGPQRKIEILLNKNNPGPGEYNENAFVKTVAGAPKCTIGKSSRSQSMVQISPGPAAYTKGDTFDQSVAKKKGFSLSFRNSEKVNAEQPGPGTYVSDSVDKLKFKSLSFSVGKTEKLKMDNAREFMTVPGPEKYNVNNSSFAGTKGVMMAKDQRKGLGVASMVPGPGMYDSKLPSNQPKFSVPKSHSSFIKPSSNPGPLDYTPKIESSKIGTNMIKDKRRPFYDQKKEIPGPGSYREEVVGKSKGGYTIGHQKRDNPKTSNLSGPGYYDIPTVVSNLPTYAAKK